jgi:hypothetical protein
VAFVSNPAGRRVRTNNHVERANRMLPSWDKMQYKPRQRWVDRFVVLTLDLWCRQRAGEAPTSPRGATQDHARLPAS